MPGDKNIRFGMKAYNIKMQNFSKFAQSGIKKEDLENFFTKNNITCKDKKFFNLLFDKIADGDDIINYKEIMGFYTELDEAAGNDDDLTTDEIKNMFKGKLTPAEQEVITVERSETMAQFVKAFDATNKAIVAAAEKDLKDRTSIAQGTGYTIIPDKNSPRHSNVYDGNKLVYKETTSTDGKTKIISYPNGDEDVWKTYEDEGITYHKQQRGDNYEYQLEDPKGNQICANGKKGERISWKYYKGGLLYTEGTYSLKVNAKVSDILKGILAEESNK